MLKNFTSILLAIIFFNVTTRGQSITQDVIGNGGGTFEQTSGSLQFNIGEPMIETYVEPFKPQMYLGFEQGSYSIVGVEENRLIPNIEMSLYPNPSNGHFNLQIDKEDVHNFDLIVNDQLGKVLLEKDKLLEKITPIDISVFEGGIYYIVIANEHLDYRKTFKIIKY